VEFFENLEFELKKSAWEEEEEKCYENIEAFAFILLTFNIGSISCGVQQQRRKLKKGKNRYPN